jgi:bis(5'-adenosyl)-triphosphatase
MKNFTDIDCPFCDASRERSTFAERGEFLAIYNIAPILPGHSLIIPRWHVSSLLDLSDAEIAEMVRFSRDVVRNLMIIFGATGFNWTVQEGEESGQTVPHLHLHLIPRSSGDLPSPGAWYPELIKSESDHIDSQDRFRLTQDQLATVADRIRSEWKI